MIAYYQGFDGVRDEQRRDRCFLVGFTAGTILYGAKGSFKAEIDSFDDAKSHLRRLKKVGAISVKSYNQPRREQRQQVIEAARELEMMVPTSLPSSRPARR